MELQCRKSRQDLIFMHAIRQQNRDITKNTAGAPWLSNVTVLYHFTSSRPPYHYSTLRFCHFRPARLSPPLRHRHDFIHRRILPSTTSSSFALACLCVTMSAAMVTTSLNVADARTHFPALQQDHQVFFDNAGGTQALSTVASSYD